MAGKDEPKDPYEIVLDVYKDGLDDLVSVNSLFTIAVFIGLALPGEKSLENGPDCDAGPTEAKRLVVMEVISFSCFLLSSLVAKSLKVSLRIYRRKAFDEKHRLLMHKWLLLVLSVVASFLGCFFLMMSMIYVIQIRLGKLSCGSLYTESAIVSMISIVSVAMLIRMYLVIDALHLARKPVDELVKNEIKTDQEIKKI